LTPLVEKVSPGLGPRQSNRKTKKGEVTATGREGWGLLRPVEKNAEVSIPREVADVWQKETGKRK